MNKPVNKQEGFTIIEVVLVLAIAALIFLVVFLALPALQRSQRDTQRKSDFARMATAITQYQSNNQGKVPATSGEITTLVNSYLKAGGSSFNDPQGDAYTISTTAALGAVPPVGTIYYYTSAKCNGQVSEANTGNTRSIAIVGGIEQGGSVCQGN